MKKAFLLFVACLFSFSIINTRAYATQYEVGDLNENGEIDLLDVITLLRSYLEISDIDIVKGDLNNNGQIDLQDVIILLRKYLGLSDVSLTVISPQTWTTNYSLSAQEKEFIASSGYGGRIIYSISSQKSGNTDVAYFSIGSQSVNKLMMASNTPVGEYVVTIEASIINNQNTVLLSKNIIMNVIVEDTDVDYMVYHYTKDVNANTYSLYEAENLVGLSNSSLILSNLKKEITGFTYINGSLSGGTGGPDMVVTSTTINPDGTTKIYLFYDRNSYMLTLNSGTGISNVSGEGTYEYGASVNIDATVKEGYTWSTWTKTSGTMPNTFNPSTKSQTMVIGADDVTLDANAIANTYTIAYTCNGGTCNGPTSGIYDQVVTISNPTRSGYTFTGWTSTTTNGTPQIGSTSNSLSTWTPLAATKNQYFKNLRNDTGTVTMVANWRANTITSLDDQIVYEGTTISGAVSKIISTNEAITGGLYTYKFYSDNECLNEIVEPNTIGVYYASATLEATNNYNSSQSGCAKYEIIKSYLTLSPYVTPSNNESIGGYLSFGSSIPNVNNNTWEIPLEFNNSVHGSSKLTLKVDKEFIRNEDAYYDISLEYYDEGNSQILLQVSSDIDNTPNYAVTGYGCYREESWCNWNSDNMNSRNIIHNLTNTNSWKTHSFRVNSVFFDKNTDNYIHLYFGMPENIGITNIKIKKITLTKRTFLINSIDKNNPNNTPMTGNVYNDNNFGLGFSIINTTEVSRNVHMSYRLLNNSSEIIYGTDLGNVSIGNSIIKRFIDYDSLKYGIYKLCVTLDYADIAEEECFDFSKIVTVNAVNDFVGADIILPNHGWVTDSEIDANVDLLTLSGIDQVRYAYGGSELAEDASWINASFPIGRYTNTYQRLIDKNMRILTIGKAVKIDDIVVIDGNHTLNDYLEDYSITASDGTFEGKRFKNEIFQIIKSRALADLEKMLNADTKYGKKIEYYELLNEWNFDSPYNSISAEQYAEIAANMSEMIKEHNPNAKVIGIVTGDDVWNTYQFASYYSETEPDHDKFKTSSWIARVFASNVYDKDNVLKNFLSYIDMVSLHIYSYDDNKTPSQNYFDERVNGVRECIEYYLRENNINKVIPIIISETGYSAKTSDIERANNIIKTLVWGQSKNVVPENSLCSFDELTGRPYNCSSYINKIYLFSFQDDGKTYAVAGGILNYQLYGDAPTKHYERDVSMSAKSAYVGVTMYNKMLADATFNFSEINSDYTYYKYTNNNKTIIIVWDDDSTNNVLLSSLGITNQNITVYDIYGNQITDYGSNSNNITVNATPKYIVYSN